MSGHLLSTMNPQVDFTPDNMPNVGEFVVFVARPGEGRRGRIEFPALVMAQSDVRGPSGLDLLVIYDANDVIYKDSCQILDGQQDSSAWRHMPPHGPSDIGSLMADMERRVFGEWNDVPGGSIMDFLVKMDERVNKLEAAKSSPIKGRSPKA